MLASRQRSVASRGALRGWNPRQKPSAAQPSNPVAGGTAPDAEVNESVFAGRTTPDADI